ncbi:peptidoglycan-binding protein [Methanobrevibacter sp.]|uniref:peptidoglycan-binding protein n=1 Tax=Methanobrevibacter sp. TaxID=66852 RepID=UPI00257D8E98|nr:peptidoglycan-binding protein [Methanobrevibacter sp.]MBR2665191.1 peptidoglycan-binding protein [Methanobrevibacter sp.]
MEMKFKKSFSTLILLLCVLFTMTCAFAGDVNDTMAVSLDNSQMEMSQDDENNEVIFADEAQPIGETDNGTFAALESKINAGYGSTITLKNNYTYEGSGYTNGIPIAGGITIDGKGHTIDADGKARIFDVQYGVVTLKNIVFKNGYQSFFFGGGAVRVMTIDCVIDNCTFIDNSAPKGGAIEYQGGWNNVTNCTFIGNYAGQVGSAIYLGAANCMSISRCLFIGNDIGGSQADSSKINNNIFIFSGASFDFTFNLDLNNNWFGNNAYYYDEAPQNNMNAWLFLNATAEPDEIPISGTSDVTFKLYLYNESSGKVLDYDNSLLPEFLMTLFASNGKLSDYENVTLGQKIQFTGTALGVGTVGVEMDDSSFEIEIPITQMKTEIAADDVTSSYNDNKNLVITLKDANGKPVAGASISVDLKGVKKYTTDAKGQVKVSTKGLAPDKYVAKIAFAGNDNYTASSKEVKVTVNKLASKITAKAKTFKTTVKTKKFTVTLKDETGKSIKKAQITLKVNGETYEATTNSKGKATFEIAKLTKKGTYKATVTFKGDAYYKKATKKVNIKVKAAFKTVSKGSKDKATVKKIQRALKKNGYYLSYKGHYLMVDGIYHDCTVRAVKQFQKAKHLKVTGKVDEKTAKKLGII